MPSRLMAVHAGVPLACGTHSKPLHTISCEHVCALMQGSACTKYLNSTISSRSNVIHRLAAVQALRSTHQLCALIQRHHICAP